MLFKQKSYQPQNYGRNYQVLTVVLGKMKSCRSIFFTVTQQLWEQKEYIHEKAHRHPLKNV